jgi:hypothetical protein
MSPESTLAEYAEGSHATGGHGRAELFEPAPTWASTARNSNPINLSPPSEIETAKLVANLLELAVLPAEVQTATLARSGRNPPCCERRICSD